MHRTSVARLFSGLVSLPFFLLCQSVLSATGVCTNTPGMGERVKCYKPLDSPDDIDIDLVGQNIATTGDGETAVHVQHEGIGDVDVNLVNTTLSTAGAGTMGMRVNQDGTGELSLRVSGGSVTTTGGTAAGNAGADGIYAFINAGDAANFASDLDAELINTTISTMSPNGQAVDLQIAGVALSQIEGDLDLRVRGSTITTSATANGANGYTFAHALALTHDGIGDSTLDVRDSTVSTQGTISHGIYAFHFRATPTLLSKGNVRIDVRNSDVLTAGTGLSKFDDTYSHGVYGRHFGIGNIDIDVTGGTVTTKGINSQAVLAHHHGTGSDRTIEIDVKGATITAEGAASSAVAAGRINSGAPERFAALDADGYRRQTVTINGPVMGGTGEAAGVFLSNGGRVIIGPQGSVGASSGIAILATGTVPAVMDDPGTTDIDESVDAIPPKLRVDLNLGGRKLAKALGDDWIINDGGETTIAVNNVVLHDGATGVTGATVHNGIWDVTMTGLGVMVTDRTTGPFTTGPMATGVFADRDFSVDDFTEDQARCPAGRIGTPPNCMRPAPPPPPSPPPPPPPPAPMCPEGQIGEPPNCMDPPPPTFLEVPAPRAAVYSTLPNVVQGVVASVCTNLHIPERHGWIRLQGSSRSQEFTGSHMGSDSDAEYLSVEAGVTLLTSPQWRLAASLHQVDGDADISSPVQGGNIGLGGKGLSLHVHLHGGNGYASVRGSWTNYTMDAVSDGVGVLETSLDAEGYVLHAEVGRHNGHGTRQTGAMHWSPRMRLHYTDVSIDGFTDSVGAEVSFSRLNRYQGSFGVLASRNWAQASVFASLDYERILSGKSTRATVSGEVMRTWSEEGDSLILSVGGTRRKAAWIFSGEITARKILGQNRGGVSGTVRVGLAF